MDERTNKPEKNRLRPQWWLVLAGLLVVLAGSTVVLLVMPWRDAADSEAIRADPHHDFGLMAPGQRGMHAFIIENRSSDPLRIESGAANRLLPKVRDTIVIPPRSAYGFEVSWRTPSADTGFDSFWGSVRVKMDRREQRVIDLVVTGDVGASPDG